MNRQDTLVDELEKLLRSGHTHATLDDVLDGLTPEDAGKKHGHLPYTIWQLTEHIRISQWDMLEFSKSGDHQSPEWPGGYWPKETAPADGQAWQQSVSQVKKDLEEFIGLLKTGDLYQPFPHGDGQSLLREAMQIADHNSYHAAEIIVLRRLLGAWK